ncbi:MAG: 3-oxoacyl-[acyl-carrier-protein] reductase [Candidatus Margulisbacteria bacterium]|nr:3-oxoacyl-[acyl-carrier-protein] reductase [Candidatus Margulisiibacteriota bacterium]
MLKDKNAFVTGAAQGIGRAIAMGLAKEGANIVVSDINIELAGATADEIKKLGVKAVAVRTNVAELCEVEESVRAAVSELGKIDIFVNNAGITKDSLLIRMKPEEWDAVINVNLKGVFNCSKAIVPLMMKQRSGKIVNIASIVGEMGNAGQLNYSASKAGVIGMTKTLARELAGRNIMVNAVAPGFIDTEMTKKLPQDAREKLMGIIPQGRLGQPEDVANAVLFLAGPMSDYITGQVINVNGGMLMNT